MKCPNCGSDNAAGARFCYNCGASIAVADAPTPLSTEKQPVPPADQPPIERTVVMSLPPNMFQQPPPAVPPPPPQQTQYAPPPASETQYAPPPPMGAETRFDMPPPASPVDTTGIPAAAPRPSGMAKRSGLAVAALIAGIVAIIPFCNLGIIVPIVAIVLGVLARNQIAKSAGMLTGGGFAVAGIVLGAIGLIFGIIGIVLSVVLNLAALGGA